MKDFNIPSLFCFLYILKFIRCDGALYTRDRNFDDKYKTGFETRVHKVSGHGSCGVYAVSGGTPSFFFNQLTYECQLVYGVHDDVIGASPYPGNSYFIVEESELEVSVGCSATDLSNGFTSEPTTGLCFKVFGTSSSWEAARDHCETLGYQLVVLDTLSKAQLVSDFIEADSGSTEDGYWIGLSESTGWVDNSALTSTHWGTVGETLDTGMCVRLDRMKECKWKDDHCNSSRGHICQTVA